MKILKMLSQSRRDFTATLICESCDHEEHLDTGYDDAYYHSSVLPNMKCSKCGESTLTSKTPVTVQATRYPEGHQV